MFNKYFNAVERMSIRAIGKFNLKFSLPNKPKPTYGEFKRLNKLWMKNSREGVKEIIQSELKVQLDKAMQSSVWGWSNLTLRKNGTTVRTPRDIVDTGYLMSSLSQTVHSRGHRTWFKGVYKAPYAMINHYGGRGPHGNFFWPRPWIKALFEGTNGIQKFEVREFLDASVKAEFNKLFG